MGGETQSEVSGWTIDTFALYATKINDERDLRYEQRFRAQQEALSYALNAAKEAVVKAELATEKRFDSVNEFRDALNDAALRMMPRNETESIVKALAERIEILAANSQHGAEGNSARIIAIEAQKKGSSTTVSTLIAIGAVVVAIAFGLWANMPHPGIDPPYASTTAAMAALNQRIDRLQATKPP